MTKRSSEKGPRKALAKYGSHGRRVNVFLRGGLVTVEWREGPTRRRCESWPDSRENRVRARAYAEGVASTLDKRGQVYAPLTLHELFQKYLVAESPAWRPATRTNALAHWKLFTLIVGETQRADVVTPELMDEVAQRLRARPAKPGTTGERPRSPVQVAATCAAVRRVFKWAAQRRLLAADPLISWRPKLAKDERAAAPAEYTPAEAAAILAAVDRRSSRQWRAWVTFTLAAVLGRRQRAILGLEWGDVDLVARTVTWRAELDKQGRGATVPLTRSAVHALRVARVWGGGTWSTAPRSRFVVPSAQARRADAPWTYQAANQALHEAEIRAGVPRRVGVAMHAFRRGVVTSVHEATGNLELAGALVGDRDVRTLRRSYLKDRPEQLQQAAEIASTRVLGSQMAIKRPK